jgi:murein DD-endopeptidase MepM/ murein hydrolase activator NlpD
MSSPEEPTVAGEDRRLTIIVVPHGDLETRSFIISYRKLKVLVVFSVALLLVVGLALAFLFPIMAQAARVPGLERDLQDLEEQRSRVVDLARTLQEVEAQYERVRQLLGADAMLSSDSMPVLPPLRGGDTMRTAPRGDSGPAGPGTGDSGADNHPGDSAALIDHWPLSVAGYVTRSLSDGRSRHPGVDIAVPPDSYIRAAGAGRVRAAGVDEVYGRYVVVEHGEGLETVYGHASRIFVTAGDRVGRGEVIALTGSTGRSTAPHLHFEVRHQGRPVDPFLYVRQP